MTTTQDKTKTAYVARCRCGCGRMVFASMAYDENRKILAKDVSRLIREGYTVELSDVDAVRSADWSTCPSHKP